MCPRIRKPFINHHRVLLLGEQVDRYLDAAGDGQIVGPKPGAQGAARVAGHGLDRGMGLDEIGVWGNRRHSASGGRAERVFKHWEFVIRVQAGDLPVKGARCG